MAINYTIVADIIDITVDAPKADDVFLVDTNVWYWMTYTRASQCVRPPAQYQTSSYPSYINAALNADAKILQCGLTLAELTHLIEKAEFEIFSQSNLSIFPDPRKFNKDFRHSFHAERAQVISEVESAWAQVESLSSTLPLTINNQATQAAIQRFRSDKIDGYDLFILETMKNHDIVKVLTDDGDFASVAGIQVFTANRNVISAARATGRLVAR